MENKILNRHQRRHKDRVEQEAHATISLMAEKFFQFFTTCDNPEGDEVIERRNKMSAQWRSYCKRRGLLPAAFDMLDKSMDDVIQSYKTEKNPEPVAQ
jgi:hypothetical protein